MTNIIKSIIVLFLELIIFQSLGYAMCKSKYFPDANTYLQKSIYGFLGYHVLFWCISFPCTLRNKSLKFLTIVWCIFISIFILIIIFYYFNRLLDMYKCAFITALKYKLYLIPCLFIIILFIYYICVNGSVDIDSRTYIGEVTSMIDTGKLSGISVTSGMHTQLIQFKRSFSMFGANSAVLCNIFQIHPLVFCRTTRATINVLFFCGTSFEIFRWLYRAKVDSIEHALLCVMLTISTVFFFANTIYTESTFLLHRAYEGKAYCATTFVLITILITIYLCEFMDKRFFFLLFLDLLAGISISASATFVLPLISSGILLIQSFIKKRWEYIWGTILTILPNLIYLVLSISGFAGFHLEG